MTIVTELEGFWSTLIERGIGVLLLQLLLMVVAAAAAYLIHRYSHRELTRRLSGKDIFWLRRVLLKIGQRLALPVSGLFVVLVGKLVFSQFGFPTPLLNIIVKLLLALAIIRITVYALRVGIAPGPTLQAWEKVISTAVWAVVALHLVGWLPALEAVLNQLAVSVGEHRISLLMGIKLLVLSGLYILVAVWLSGLIEQYLRRVPQLNVSLRVALGKISRVMSAHGRVSDGADGGGRQPVIANHLRRRAGRWYRFWTAKDCQQLHQRFHPAGGSLDTPR